MKDKTPLGANYNHGESMENQVQETATAEQCVQFGSIVVEYNWRAATPALNLALAKARGEFPSIPKTKTAHVKLKDNKGEYSFKFADLSDVMDAVKDALSKYELAVTHTTGPGRESLILETSIRHSSGEMIRSLMPMPFMEGRPQDWGSMLTYLRRYLVSAMLGIASDEDDDGNAAQGNQRDLQDSKKKVDQKPKAQPVAGPKPAAPKPQNEPPVDQDYGPEPPPDSFPPDTVQVTRLDELYLIVDDMGIPADDVKKYIKLVCGAAKKSTELTDAELETLIKHIKIMGRPSSR